MTKPPTQSSSNVDTQTTNPCGKKIVIVNAKMNIKWRVFSRKSETYTNCVLMRRSSYCSLEMRVWRLLSLGTWFDANTLRSGITLGSLGIQSRGPPSIPASHSLVIRARKFDSAASKSKGTDLNSQSKTVLLRHKDILQCPWNALAMLLFYKWHVLKEPPPNFEDPAWANQPLFHIDPALHDGELEQFCGDIYSEFVEGASHGVQQFKYTTESALNAITDALSTSELLKNAVSAAQNMYVTQRSLQNGHCADVQLANAGFRSDIRATTYNVPRQKHSVPQHIEEQIFPFVDTMPRRDDLVDQGRSPEQWDTIVRFCNLLKMLRTVLLQDMAILCDIPFYRRMLHGTAVFSSDIFQSIQFVQSTDAIRKHSWNSDFLPLVENTPSDSRLARVVPCAAFTSSGKKLTEADATISQVPIAVTPALIEPVGGLCKTDHHSSKITCTEPSKSVPSDAVLPKAGSSKSELPDATLQSTKVSSAKLPVAKSLVMASNIDPEPSSADSLPRIVPAVSVPSSAVALPSVKPAVPAPSSAVASPSVKPAVPAPSSADPSPSVVPAAPAPSSAVASPSVKPAVPAPSRAVALPSVKPAVPAPSSVDPLSNKRKLPNSDLDDGVAPPHPRLDSVVPPIFDKAKLQHMREIFQSYAIVPPHPRLDSESPSIIDMTTAKRKLDSVQSDDSVPEPKRKHVYDISSSDESPASPTSDPVFVDLTLDSDDDEDDNREGREAQIQDLTGVESDQILDESSKALVDRLEELAVLPIDQDENLVRDQDQEVDKSPGTTAVQTPVSSTVSADGTDQTVSKPLESILTAAELQFAARISGRSEALLASADTSDTQRGSSCTSGGCKSDDSLIQGERPADESDLRKKAALTDKLLQFIRDIGSELSEAAAINQSMHRQISHIAVRQKHPDPSTVNEKTSTQLPTSSTSSSDRLQRSLAKLEMVAKRNSYHMTSAANTATRILEEAESEL
ncbi:hypothetical protein J3F80_004269 [Coemansia sp. RSA 2526]|nr:hypothetical protein J3F80_004269 [Coemansia sp. RSA 2526]